MRERRAGLETRNSRASLADSRGRPLLPAYVGFIDRSDLRRGGGQWDGPEQVTAIFRELCGTLISADEHPLLAARGEACSFDLRSLPNRSKHCLFIRKLAGLQLRIDQLTVHGQLKTSATTRDELEVGDLLFEFFEQLLRQTDGLRFVVSHRAVFEFQVHGDLLESNANFLRNYTQRRFACARRHAPACCGFIDRVAERNVLRPAKLGCSFARRKLAHCP